MRRDDRRPSSDPFSNISALIFENKGSLHLISHLLAAQRLDDGQSELKAGSRPSAGEDQAVLLHAVLRVAVMTFNVKIKKGYILMGYAGQEASSSSSSPCYCMLLGSEKLKPTNQPPTLWPAVPTSTGHFKLFHTQHEDSKEAAVCEAPEKLHLFRRNQ